MSAFNPAEPSLLTRGEDAQMAEIEWLKEGATPVQARLDIDDPSVLKTIDACEVYLSHVVAQFPDRVVAEEDRVVSMLLERGSSVQEVCLLFECAFAGLATTDSRDTPDAAVAFSTGLILAHILGRLVEVYQQAWNYQWLELPDRRSA